MRLRLSIATLVVASFAAASSSGVARADERVHARLSYAPDPEVERCPSERQVRDAVSARLGYDPFDAAENDTTTRDVIVAVRKQGSGIVGSLEIRGPHPGQRELSSPDGDCREVVDALAVAIAIGLDPGSLTRPPPAPVPAPVAPPPPPPPPPPAQPAPLDIRLGAGAVAMFGELPSAAPAVAVSAALRFRWFQPTLEGLASLPVTQSQDGLGTVKASLLAATLLPCAYRDPFFACAGLTLGSLHGDGETATGTPLHGSELYAAVSARGGAELPLGQTVWVRADVEAVAPLTRITLQLASQDVWHMPAVAARVGASLGVRF